MRRTVILALPLLLGGCALPPVIGAVAYLIDGVSYIGTGKSVSDHALSAVADEDCAMWRLLKGELICQGPNDKGKPNAIAVAAATTVYPGDAPENGSDVEPTMVAEAPAAVEPAVAERLAAIAPAAGNVAPPAPAAPPSIKWEPVLTIRAPDAPPVAVAAHRPHVWPVADAEPRPVEESRTATKGRTADAATLRATRRLLDFRAPIEMLAEHPCPGSGAAVFCPLPAVGADG